MKTLPYAAKKVANVLIIDKNKEIYEWVNDLAGAGVGSARLDLATFEVAKGIESELIMMSAEIFNSLDGAQREKLEACCAVIIFNMQNLALNPPTQNIVGIVDKNTSNEILTRQIVNLEEFVKTNNFLKSQLISLNMELTGIIGGVEEQLQRVKRSYERTTPRRLEEFQGFKIFSKYAAGDDLGGEFFDLFARGDKVFVMMSRTSSYLASSVILQLFTELKSSEIISAEQELAFIQAVRDQIEELSQSQGKTIQAQLLTCVLDIKTLHISGHVLGNFKVISSEIKNSKEFTTSLEMEVEQTKFDRKISRGERIMLCSPGFEMNWASLNPKFLIEQFVMDKKYKVLDVLDEVFFQLKKDTESGFLKSDASAIIMEVQDNVMLQV